MLWSANGLTITGPLAENYSDEPGFQTPQVAFEVRGWLGDGHRLPRLVTAEDKKAVFDLASKIETAFQ